MPDSDTAAVTVGALAASGRWVIAECVDCGYRRKIPADRIALPPETPIADASKHMRCSKCRGKRITTRPE